MSTLYRTYRPQVFEEIVGQNHIKLTLLNELTSGRIAHAYLFSGPRGVGKTTVARLLAKAVNCEHPNKDGSADDACAACVEIREGRCLDLIEIDAASHTGVDNVREQIIENSRFHPTRWKYKVFIIDEVHMLSLSAFNALLKTLEEPPQHVIFILATTELHKVPETIISRCQRFDFRRLRQEDLIERLSFIVGKEGVKVQDDVLEAIARFARGSSRDAESLLGQVLTLGEGVITMEQAELVLPRSDFHLVAELFDTLVRKDATAAITLVNRLVSEGVNLAQFVQNAIEFFRKALLLKVNSQLDMFSTLELSNDDEKALLRHIEQVTVADVERMIEVFLDQEQHLRLSFIPQLPLEIAVLTLTTGSSRNAEFVADVTPGPVPSSSPAKRTHRSIAPSQPVPTPSLPGKKKGTASSAAPTLEGVKERWAEALLLLQKKNHSLRLTFNVAAPEAVDGSTLVLGVAYEFHRERIETLKNKQTIESVFTELFHAPISIRAVISGRAPAQPNFASEANVDIIELPDAAPAGNPSAAGGRIGAETTWDTLVEAFGTKKS